MYSNGKKYEFVLKSAENNLWMGFRNNVVKYFEFNNIQWHQSNNGSVNGYLLSSQVACVNHLFIAREDKEAATNILKNLDKDIVEAEIVDDGYVEFEFIGEKGLNEKNIIKELTVLL